MLASKRILIVEDDSAAASALAARLRALGCDVMAASRDLEEATTRAVADLPSVLVAGLGVAARGEGGVEGARQRFAMPVVFVAANAKLGHAAGLAPWEFATAAADDREWQIVLGAALYRAAQEQSRHELEAQLAEARRFEDLGRMAGHIAHKFNNLLMGVTSGAALVRFDLPDASPGQEHLDKIDETVERAAELCQQLLASVRRDQDAQTSGAALRRTLDPSGEMSPAPERGQTHVSPAASQQSAGIQGAVLIVDDDDAVRALARWVVEKAGYTAVTARDGDDALARFRADPGAFGLVLLDLTMPRMSGEEVLVALRAIRPNIPVVVVTGYGEEAVNEGERAGISGFLQKPFSPDALRAVLHRCGQKV